MADAEGNGAQGIFKAEVLGPEHPPPPRTTVSGSRNASRGGKSQQNQAQSALTAGSLRMSEGFVQEKVLAIDTPDSALQLEMEDDGGVIRCICGLNDDDGFTIQCDRCLVWQHCACFGMSSASVPDEYLCEQCDPRPVNIEFAQAHQQRRKDLDFRKAKAEQTLHDRKISESRSPLATAAVNLEAEVSNASVGESVAEVASGPKATPAAPKSRKPSQSIDISSTAFTIPDAPASATTQAKQQRKKPGPKPGSRRTPLATPSSATAGKSFAFPTPQSTPRDERTEDDALTPAEKQEAWQFDFTPIQKGLVVEERIFSILAAALLQYEEGSQLKAIPTDENRFLAPLSLSESEEIPDAPIEAEETQTDVPEDYRHELGLSPIRNECVPIELHCASLSEAACETYVRNISEAASSAIFTNVQFVAALPNDKARPWSATRSFSKPPMHGLFAKDAIQAGSFICEYLGEMMSADAYRADPVNQYELLGASKPHVHLFPPPLAIAIDARRFGTEARFARFGCHPNAVIRPILHYRMGADEGQSPLDDTNTAHFTDLGLGELSASSKGTEPELRFGLFALRDIGRSHEIILGWEWDDHHIVHFLPELVKNPALETEDKSRSLSLLEIVDKGDFPYSATLFSAKMNAATTALLGMTLCSCIGSATPQSGSGSGSASSHNARKQDCAVAQMLRVGQGMGLMNVNIPGSAKNSHRRLRPPDFSPLVGERRWWRPNSMPPTPISTDSDPTAKDGSSMAEWLLSQGLVPSRLSGNGRVARIMEEDIVKVLDNSEASEPADRTTAMSTSDREQSISGDAASIASSVTEPLPGLSDIEADEDDDIYEPHAKVKAPLAEDREVPLPLKKRIAGTRLKASHILNDDRDDKDHEDKTNRGNAKKAERAAAANKARAAKDAKRLTAKASRKAAASRSRQRSISRDIAEESEDEEDRRMRRKMKRKNSKAALLQPSSPLSSAPEDSDISSDDETSQQSSLVPRHRRRSTKKVGTDRARSGDGEMDSEDSSGSEPVRLQPRPKNSHKDPSDSDDQASDHVKQDSSDKLSRKRKAAKASKSERVPSEALRESSEDEAKASVSKKRRVSIADATTQASRQRPTALRDSSFEDDERQPAERSDALELSQAHVDVEIKTEATSGLLPPEAEAEPEAAPESKEPEKPRAKLSLADWKRQQAEKRKSVQAVAPLDDAVMTPVEGPVSASESAPALAAMTEQGQGPQIRASQTQSPLAPLAPRDAEPAWSPTSLSTPTGTFAPPPPLPPSSGVGQSPPPPLEASRTYMPPPPAPLPTGTSAASPTATTFPHAALSPLPTPSLPLPTSYGPLAPLPSRTSEDRLVPEPRGRVPSHTATAASPPLDPAHACSTSPPPVSGPTAWNRQSPSASSTGASIGRTGGARSPSVSSMSSHQGAGNNAYNHYSGSASGSSRSFDLPPSPRALVPSWTSSANPSTPAGFAPPSAPAGPAALRKSSFSSGTAASAAGQSQASVPTNSGIGGSSAPFNPPKGPKALINASGPSPGSTPASTGTNSISIRSAPGVSGSPPSHPVDLPTGPSGKSSSFHHPHRHYADTQSHDHIGSGVGTSSGGGNGPPRQLSILGRGMAARSTSGESDRGDRHDGGTSESPRELFGPPSYSGGSGGGYRGRGGFGARGGWSGRGGRGGGGGGGGGAGSGSPPVGGANAGATPGTGWGNRGRGGSSRGGGWS